MPTSERIARLHRLIWILIYGGLFGITIGVVIRTSAPTSGHLLIVAGIVAAVLGVVLIYKRSRMPENPPPE